MSTHQSKAVARSVAAPLDKLAKFLTALGDGDAVGEPTHLFAPGIYVRVLEMKAGTCVVSKIHKTEHFVVVLKGHCTVTKQDGTTEEIIAPRIFKTHPGTQRALYIHEDCTWATFHPTDKTDVEEITKDVIAEDWNDPLLPLLTHDKE